MNENIVAKNLLLNRTCETCKYMDYDLGFTVCKKIGLFQQRKHEKLGICDKWVKNT